MIVIPYEDRYLKEWDDFIENESENGTIFHMQKFIKLVLIVSPLSLFIFFFRGP